MSDTKQCDHCDGDGWVMHVDGRADCTVCGGAGTIAPPDWKSLLVTSSKLAAVATASRATAATLRAIGGPVAETIAARADETARTASEASLMAIAESAVRWFERSTESSR
jgi:hypothetical protein